MRTIRSQLFVVKQNAERASSNISDAVFLTQISLPGLSLSLSKGVSGNILSQAPENLPVKRCTQFKVAIPVRPEGIKGQTRRQVYRQEVGFSAAFFLSYPGNKFSSRPATSWNSGTML